MQNTFGHIRKGALLHFFENEGTVGASAGIELRDEAGRNFLASPVGNHGDFLMRLDVETHEDRIVRARFQLGVERLLMQIGNHCALATPTGSRERPASVSYTM